MNVVLAAVVAGVAAWVLYTALEPRFRNRISPDLFRAGVAVVSLALGVYVAIVLSYPELLHKTLSPAVGAVTRRLLHCSGASSFR